MAKLFGTMALGITTSSVPLGASSNLAVQEISELVVGQKPDILEFEAAPHSVL
jgi:hypothetical protein